MQEIVANKVYALRTQFHLTQEELAARLGVTRQTVIAIEKGNYTPSVLLAIRIAKVFTSRVDDIFYLHYEK
jgi:putative transcriptional regulator